MKWDSKSCSWPMDLWNEIFGLICLWTYWISSEKFQMRRGRRGLTSYALKLFRWNFPGVGGDIHIRSDAAQGQPSKAYSFYLGFFAMEFSGPPCAVQICRGAGTYFLWLEVFRAEIFWAWPGKSFALQYSVQELMKMANRRPETTYGGTFKIPNT